ncbi:helix-turn-helix domain-containing protein [Peribacillus asahii]|uniref:helix-turn-helix domain-containing protein n=1 Tax=Peribacillus asahii TaxID=228899 RepID=UPI00207AB4C2|nr:helix-turn-helix transcriptional regulator [Peribacillus asahii]USK85698.1 helix-turn-helix domain-containing protein [Peribacillus asahii]
MANTFTKTRLYPPSAIGEILKIARERARQEEQRTKRYMAKELGITVDRLTKIENGTAQAPFEIAVQWCQILSDYTALNKIKHIFGMALPPADPWLLESVADQLNNFIRQAQGAIEATKCLLDMSSQRRRNSTFSEHDKQRILELSEEILDVQQSSECVISSLKMNWNLDTDALFKNWIREALSDQVIIPSVTEFDKIRKEQYFEERSERMKH